MTKRKSENTNLEEPISEKTDEKYENEQEPNIKVLPKPVLKREGPNTGAKIKELEREDTSSEEEENQEFN